jgi:hypothetical protein
VFRNFFVAYIYIKWLLVVVLVLLVLLAQSLEPVNLLALRLLPELRLVLPLRLPLWVVALLPPHLLLPLPPLPLVVLLLLLLVALPPRLPVVWLPQRPLLLVVPPQRPLLLLLPPLPLVAFKSINHYAF